MLQTGTTTNVNTGDQDASVGTDKHAPYRDNCLGKPEIIVRRIADRPG
jgi:hypothetical protein